MHEAPTLNPKSEEVLEEYMPVTVDQPGIYIPDKFGVRIEDLAIITEFGIINAVKSQKSLEYNLNIKRGREIYDLCR